MNSFTDRNQGKRAKLETDMLRRVVVYNEDRNPCFLGFMKSPVKVRISVDYIYF